jgi:hypothetical protein
MSAQPTKKRGQPTWQSVKGTLIHRCVLAAGGKWLTVRDAGRLSGLFNLQEPNLIAEARWMARQLGPALEQRDDRLAWALIDSGGP